MDKPDSSPQAEPVAKGLRIVQISTELVLAPFLKGCAEPYRPVGDRVPVDAIIRRAQLSLDGQMLELCLESTEWEPVEHSNQIPILTPTFERKEWAIITERMNGHNNDTS